MSIKPIDMQTNIGQSHEVARNQSNRNDAVIQQQQELDNEALQISNLKDKRIFEADDTDDSENIKDKEEKESPRQRGGQEKKKKEEQIESGLYKKVEIVENFNIGKNIDFKQ